MSGLIVTDNLNFGDGLQFQAELGTSGLGVQEFAPGYDVVLLAGQSNIVGLYGPVNPAIDVTNPRIFQLAQSGPDSGTVILGVDPLWQPTQAPNSVGPGMPFARAYLPEVPSNRSILLVPRGISSTGFSAGSGGSRVWRVGDSAYNAAVSAANAAMAAGTGVNRFLGILWLQGEGDAINGLAAGDYTYYLDAMVAGMRAAISGAANSWFVNIQMNPEYFATGGAGFTAINAVHVNTPQRLLRSAYVAGAPGSGDDIHYNAAGERTNGTNAAAALSSLSTQTTLSGAPTALTSTATTATSVSLSWTAPATGAIPTDYLIEYKRAVDSVWISYAHGRSIDTTITVTGLTASTSYNFRVSAVSSPGTGSASSTYTVSTDTDSVLLWDASASSATTSITNAGLSFSRGGGLATARVSVRKSSGKWYAEVKLTARASNDTMFGFSDMTATTPTEFLGNFAKSASIDNLNSYRNSMSAGTATLASKPTVLALNDVIMWAFDADAGQGWLGFNGSWWGSQDPATGTNPVFTWPTGTLIACASSIWVLNNTLTLQSTLNYSVPSGFTQLR